MPLVQLADGSTVMFLSPGTRGDFEAQGPIADRVTTSLLQLTQRGGQVLLEAVSGLRAALSSVAPSELEIEIALSVGNEGTLIICSANAEASLTIKAVWKKGAIQDG